MSLKSLCIFSPLLNGGRAEKEGKEKRCCSVGWGRSSSPTEKVMPVERMLGDTTAEQNH